MGYLYHSIKTLYQVLVKKENNRDSFPHIRYPLQSLQFLLPPILFLHSPFFLSVLLHSLFYLYHVHYYHHHFCCFCHFHHHHLVRGHLSVSLLPVSSPTLHLFICIHPLHFYTILKDHIHSWWLLGPTVRRLPRSWLTNSWWHPASPSARTSTASDGCRTHWDRSAWCYSTRRHHVDNHIWEAWY
jgi:hypothetical protein